MGSVSMGLFKRQRYPEQTVAKDKTDVIRDVKLEAIRQETNQKFDEFAETFKAFNKVLEEKGDTAYNVFMATPASSNYRKQKK